MANTNRTKGHNTERLYAKVFKEDLGFPFCQTSRYGSRLHDDAGIDLINVPYNVQIKAGYDRGLNIKNTIDYVKNRVKELFPPGSVEDTRPTIVIHRKTAGKGKKRVESDDLVYLTFEDFKKIITSKKLVL